MPNQLTNFDRHIAVTSCYAIAEIMLPKLKEFGMNNFAYVKVNNDHSFIHLCTHQEWSNNYFKKEYFKKYTPPESVITPHPVYQTTNSTYLLKKINYFLWLTKDHPEMYIDAQVNFNLSNGIVLAERNYDSIEYYCFSTTSCNISIINNFYLNNLDILQKLGHNFKNKFEVLLKEAESNKIYFPHSNTVNKQFELKLSRRQNDCANLLLQGQSYKEMGKILNLSPRTVETHIDYLKIKFNCRSKKELIFKLFSFYSPL